MTFTRANALGWALYEVFTSAQANHIDINQSRAVDGYAGGTYNPSALIQINNQLVVDATGAAAANVAGILATGKGNLSGISGTGGTSDGTGVLGTGGATNGIGVTGVGTGTGYGVQGTGGGTNGQGVVGFGNGTSSITGTYNQAGVVGVGGSSGAHGVVGEGTGTGDGVVGVAGGTGGGGVGGTFTGAGTAGQGVVGFGSGSSTTGLAAGIVSKAGVIGVGGATGAHGVIGEGLLTGVGVYGQGGATNAAGGTFTGGGTTGTGAIGYGAGSTSFTSPGVIPGLAGKGGTTNGVGVYGEGTGNQPGVAGEGGSTDAYGGRFQGGVTNGGGVYALGVGTGVGINAIAGATGANMRLTARSGDPGTPIDGDIWNEGVEKELYAYIDSKQHQLLDTWVHATIAAGVCTMNDENNVASVTVGATTITVTFDKGFASTNYAAVVTMGNNGGIVKYFAVIDTPSTLSMTIRVYDDAGNLIAPNGGATNMMFNLVVKGYM